MLFLENGGKLNLRLALGFVFIDGVFYSFFLFVIDSPSYLYLEEHNRRCSENFD